MLEQNNILNSKGDNSMPLRLKVNSPLPKITIVYIHNSHQLKINWERK